MDITIIIELLIIIATFFAYRYGLPMLKGTIYLTIAKRLVAAANELYITNEIKDRAAYVWDEMVKTLERYKIKFDEEEVLACIKQAVTALRVEIENTNAQKVNEVEQG